jgi:hypothetical protein
MQFTEEDEEKLCEWIAAKIPYKEIGGRTGNRLYQQLCELVCYPHSCISSCLTPPLQAGEPEYAWVSRHTWQSWRERYKKNAERLDKVIARIVQQKMPQRGEKGQYGYVRQPEEKLKKGRKRRTKGTVASPAAEESPNEMMKLPAAGPSYLHTAMGPSEMGVQPVHPTITSLHQLTSMGNPYTGVIAPPSDIPVPADTANLRASSTEEELEDDGTEWAVRIGNAPPPTWGKRKMSDHQDQDDHSKRPRLEK